MEKTESVKIRRFGRSYIVFGVIIIALAMFYATPQILSILHHETERLENMGIKGAGDLSWLIFFVLIPSLCHIIVGAGVIGLRSWARRSLFLLLPIGLLLSPVYAFFGLWVSYIAIILLIVIVWYWFLAIDSFSYFRNPKVKEQFKY